MTTARKRFCVRALWVLTYPIVSCLWLLLGLFSMRRLGIALEATGKNLQQKYDW